ncbi:response regulator [Neobacillus sp. PS3-12]|uniref:response regulator transcription factor n=1 Tax=Neobacillus sp. PS3-12 TaxID=3070677 RepID=UPI0027E17EAF|nr:response regulator [Neobacillus sp. PS3-12]WML55154.1 response regulator [Neobacillus sp. PS3-12]
MKRILLAEDEEILRMLIVDTLEDEIYLIDEAEDGQEALHYIKENQYDLIILDYMMPVLTGLDVIKIVRLEKQDVKILMLSAKSQLSDQEKAFDTGADYFMAKPFSPNELLEKIKVIFNEN